jgi:hypothetical protein
MGPTFGSVSAALQTIGRKDAAIGQHGHLCVAGQFYFANDSGAA